MVAKKKKPSKLIKRLRIMILSTSTQISFLDLNQNQKWFIDSYNC